MRFIYFYMHRCLLQMFLQRGLDSNWLFAIVCEQFILDLQRFLQIHFCYSPLACILQIFLTFFLQIRGFEEGPPRLSTKSIFINHKSDILQGFRWLEMHFAALQASFFSHFFTQIFAIVSSFLGTNILTSLLEFLVIFQRAFVCCFQQVLHRKRCPNQTKMPQFSATSKGVQTLNFSLFFSLLFCKPRESLLVAIL